MVTLAKVTLGKQVKFSSPGGNFYFDKVLFLDVF